MFLVNSVCCPPGSDKCEDNSNKNEDIKINDLKKTDPCCDPAEDCCDQKDSCDKHEEDSSTEGKMTCCQEDSKMKTCEQKCGGKEGCDIEELEKKVADLWN